MCVYLVLTVVVHCVASFTFFWSTVIWVVKTTSLDQYVDEGCYCQRLTPASWLPFTPLLKLELVLGSVQGYQGVLCRTVFR
jgi:hypothetical protein